MARRRVGHVRPGESAGRGYTLVYVTFRKFRGPAAGQGNVVSAYLRVPVSQSSLGNVLRLALQWLRGYLDRIGRQGSESGGSVSDWEFSPDLSIGI